MVRKTLKICLLCASALALSACDDALVGTWRTDDKINCDRRGKMTIESDLEGEGKIPFRDCTDCIFKVEAQDSDSDEYEYDVKITMEHLRRLWAFDRITWSPRRGYRRVW